MGQHKLALNFPDLTNEGVIVVEDISSYDDVLPVLCPTLQITYPGQPGTTLLENLTPGFRLVLNACNIGILASERCSDTCPSLPDGIYTFRYSVAPNDEIYVTYRYMRTVKAWNRYCQILCSVNLQCCIPSQEEQYILHETDIIRNFILSAKVAVENCNRPEDGINFLRFANQLMDKMTHCKPRC